MEWYSLDNFLDIAGFGDILRNSLGLSFLRHCALHSASFAVARCILSGSTMSLIWTAVTCVPQASVFTAMFGPNATIRDEMSLPSQLCGQPRRWITSAGPSSLALAPMGGAR
jgi:hypothetical protein